MRCFIKREWVIKIDCFLFLTCKEKKSILNEDEIRERICKIIDPNLVKEAIQCLEEFDYCFKLEPEEEVVYEEKGYLFPSLRPKKDFALG